MGLSSREPLFGRRCGRWLGGVITACADGGAGAWWRRADAAALSLRLDRRRPAIRTGRDGAAAVGRAVLVARPDTIRPPR